jgi:hypothetical protein
VKEPFPAANPATVAAGEDVEMTMDAGCGGGWSSSPHIVWNVSTG